MENKEIIANIYKEQITQQGLIDLSAKYPKDMSVDVSTKENMTAYRKIRTERNDLVKAINRRRIDLSKELKERGDSLIEEVNSIYDVVVIPFEAEDSRLKKKKEEEDRKHQKMLDEERARIDTIRSMYIDAKKMTSDEIQGVIEAIDLVEVDTFHKEVIHEAIEAKKETLQNLVELLEDVKQREKVAKQQKDLEIEKRILAIRSIPMDMMGKTKSEVSLRLTMIRGEPLCSDFFGENMEEASKALQTSITQLESILRNMPDDEQEEPDISQEDDGVLPGSMIADAYYEDDGVLLDSMIADADYREQVNRWMIRNCVSEQAFYELERLILNAKASR